jgi:hypothetical protein
LVEHFWHTKSSAATTRYYVIELATGALTRYAQSFQAYTQPEYTELLQDCGFDGIDFVPALTGAPEPDQPDLFVIVARKPAEATRASAPKETDLYYSGVQND